MLIGLNEVTAEVNFSSKTCDMGLGLENGSPEYMVPVFLDKVYVNTGYI